MLQEMFWNRTFTQRLIKFYEKWEFIEHVEYYWCVLMVYLLIAILWTYLMLVTGDIIDWASKQYRAQKKAVSVDLLTGPTSNVGPGKKRPSCSRPVPPHRVDATDVGLVLRLSKMADERRHRVVEEVNQQRLVVEEVNQQRLVVEEVNQQRLVDL